MSTTSDADLFGASLNPDPNSGSWADFQIYRTRETIAKMKASQVRLAALRLSHPPAQRRLEPVLGYASIHTVNYRCGGKLERLQEGAFERSLRPGHLVDALINHDVGRRVGSTETGSLRLVEDAFGLRVLLEPERAHAAALLQALKAGKVAGMSIDGRPTRTCTGYVMGEPVTVIQEFELWEVTFVLPPERPANRDTYANTVANLRGLNGDYVRSQARGDRGLQARARLIDLANQMGGR